MFYDDTDEFEFDEEDEFEEDDLRSFPDRTLELYSTGIVAWGIALLALFLAEQTAWALALSFLLFAYQAILTGVWASDMLARFNAGEFTRGEADAGVLSVSRILTGSSALPAIVFLVEDSLKASAWAASAGVVLFAALVWIASGLLVRLSNRFTHTIVLVLATLALPINATGAVSFAIAFGFFDKMLL